MKITFLVLCLVFCTIGYPYASTVITATGQSDRIITAKVEGPAPADLDTGLRSDVLRLWVTLKNAPPSCELADVPGGSIKYKTTGTWFEPVKSHAFDSAERLSDGSFYVKSSYLDNKYIFGIDASVRIKCRAPTAATKVTLHYVLRNQYAGHDRDMFPDIYIAENNPTVSVEVYDYIDFGTIFDTTPTNWTSLWVANTPENAKVTVDGHILGGEGESGFSINTDIGTLEFKVNGWIRFVPNGKPGTLRRYLHFKIEYV